jgi:glutamate synthase domain-containing protein 1
MFSTHNFSFLRRATHGGKTDANAHPHTDSKQRVAVIHNGTINNSYELKKELQAQGIKFLSETDTEVIAQLIGIYLDKGLDIKDAVVHALSRYDISTRIHGSHAPSAMGYIYVHATYACSLSSSISNLSSLFVAFLSFLSHTIDATVAGASLCSTEASLMRSSSRATAHLW